MNIFKALALKWVIIIGITKALKKAAENVERRNDDAAE